jgi:hypothetical protein
MSMAFYRDRLIWFFIASLVTTGGANATGSGTGDGTGPGDGTGHVKPPKASKACTANLESTNPTTDETVESFIAILKRATENGVLTPNQIQKWWNGVWNTKQLTNPFLGMEGTTRFQDAFDLLMRSSDVEVADFQQKTKKFLQTLSSQLRNENHAKQDTYGVLAPHIAQSIPFSSPGATHVAFYRNNKGEPLAAYIDIQEDALVTVDLTTRQPFQKQLQLDGKVFQIFEPFRDAQGRLWLPAVTRPEDPKEGGPKLRLISPGDHRNQIDIDIPAAIDRPTNFFRSVEVRILEGSNFLIGIDPLPNKYLADINSPDPTFVPIKDGSWVDFHSRRVTPSGNLIGVISRFGVRAINQVTLYSAVPWHENGQYEYSKQFGMLHEDVIDYSENRGLHVLWIHVLNDNQYVIEFRGNSHVRFFKADRDGSVLTRIGTSILTKYSQSDACVSNSFSVDGQTKIVVLTDKGTARVINLSAPNEIVEIPNVPSGFEVGGSPIKKNGRWYIRLEKSSYSNGNRMTEYLLLDLSGTEHLGPFSTDHPGVDGHDDDRHTITLDDGRRVFPRATGTDFVLADVTKTPSSLLRITGLAFGKIGLQLPDLERDGFLNIGDTLVVADDKGVHFIEMFRDGAP